MGDKPLIEYFCVRDDHRANGDIKISDHLTINERAWAYCPRDVRLADHYWEHTGGIAVEEITRFARTREQKRTTKADPGRPTEAQP